MAPPANFQGYFSGSLQDDTGTRKDGTVFDKALFVALGLHMDEWLLSAGYPTRFPNDTTDQVNDARGAYATLAARLAAISDPTTGVPNATTFIAYLTAATMAKQVSSHNLCCNDDFLLWPNGDTAIPSYWTLSGGTPPTIQRCGSGLADTTTKVGPYCARLTFGANPCFFYSTPISTTAAALMTHFKGVAKFAFGMWVKTSTANSVRLFIDDGVTQTTSSYHTGDGTFQFLAIPSTLWGASATQLLVGLRFEAAGDCYVSGSTCMLSEFGITRHVPCLTETVAVADMFLSGNAATGDDKKVIPVGFPFLLKDALAVVTTAPTTSALVFDIDWLDFSGGVAPSRQVPYSTKLQIAALAGSGRAAPDGTYQYRCFQPNFSGGKKGGGIAINIDTDDGGNTAVGAAVTLIGMRYKRPEWISRYGGPHDGY